jgi:hypothetical protein
MGLFPTAIGKGHIIEVSLPSSQTPYESLFSSQSFHKGIEHGNDHLHPLGEWAPRWSANIPTQEGYLNKFRHIVH